MQTAMWLVVATVLWLGNTADAARRGHAQLNLTRELTDQSVGEGLSKRSQLARPALDTLEDFTHHEEVAMNFSGMALALLYGVNRQQCDQAAIMTVLSFFIILGGTLTASVVTTLDPRLVPDDFMQKGTLSNVAQDVTTPHGRLWTTALFIAPVLLITSMYPFWIYRSWVPWLSEQDNPLGHGVFESSGERLFRTVWE